MNNRVDEQHITVPQKIIWIYGFAELSAYMLLLVTSSYFSFYITDLLKLPTTVLASVIAITRFFDLASTLGATYLEEKITLKQGKHRPWIIWMVPLAYVASMLMFSAVSKDAMVNCTIACVCNIATFIGYNFIRTAHLALMNAIGKTVEDRQLLSARKAQFGFVNNVITSAGFLPLALLLSSPSNQTTISGFRAASWVCFTIYAIGQLVLYYNTKQYDPPQEKNTESTKKTEKTKENKRIFYQIMHNPPLIELFLAETFKGIAYGLFNGLVIYYFIIVASDLMLQPRYATIASIFTFLGSMFMGRVVRKRLSKKTAYIMGISSFMAALLVVYFFARSNTILFTVLMCAGLFFYSSVQVTGPAMFGDCVEYGINKTGLDGRSFIMGLYLIPVKLSKYIQGLMHGALLIYVGYNANEPITEAIRERMMTSLFIVPFLIAALCLICAIIYPLSDKKVKTVMEENKLAGKS